MDLFRKNQKLVFWILTPIIIVAFVVWGVGDFIGRDNYGEFEMGRVDGKAITFRDYEAFRKRLQAALGTNITLQFNGQPYANTRFEDLWKHVFAYALLQDAEKAGARASDLQVGTYLENEHPNTSLAFKESRPAMERAVDALCAQHQITRQDFIRGLRDFLTMGNYVVDDSNLAVPNDATAYAFYALARAECVIKRVRIMETDAIREQAKKDVMERPAADLEADVRAYIAGKADDRRYREPSGWRFAYVLTPFVQETSVPGPTKTEIKDYFDGNPARFEGKTLEEAEEEIKTVLRQNEIERQTVRNFTIDVDPQLRNAGGEADLSELVKLTQLVKYGVTAADTGPEPLSPAEVIKKLPAGADFTVRMMLEDLDSQPSADRDAFFTEWKSGFLLVGRPFKSDAGYFRLQLLDYRPSSPKPAEDAEGKINPELFELAVADMVGDRARQLVEEKAMATEQSLRDLLEAAEKGEKTEDSAMAAEFAALSSETVPYSRLQEQTPELIRMGINELHGPVDYKDAETGAEGKEIIVLVGRRLPGRDAYLAEADPIKARHRQNASMPFRGGLSFSYTDRGPTATIHPSPTVLGNLLVRYYRGEIFVNPELMRADDEKR